MEKLIIIGSGPAGLTAAIYSARADFKPLVIAGYQAGGQLMTTTEVENFPGFKKGIQGPELMQEFREQALRFGARLVDKDVTEVDFRKRPFTVKVGQEVYESQCVIVATGAQAKLLGLPEEKSLMGKGLSTCATCDGAFFRNEEICVVGGGDSAMEEANFLTRFAAKVYVIHRRDTLRASKIMQQRAFDNKKIEFVWNSHIVQLKGQKALESVTVENLVNKERRDLKVTGCFVAVGHKPNTDLFKGQLDCEDNGYLKISNNTRTNIDGIFSAGDVSDFRYRQAVTAAGMGCMAALDAQHYLETHA